MVTFFRILLCLGPWERLSRPWQTRALKTHSSIYGMKLSSHHGAPFYALRCDSSSTSAGFVGASNLREMTRAASNNLGSSQTQNSETRRALHQWICNGFATRTEACRNDCPLQIQLLPPNPLESWKPIVALDFTLVGIAAQINRGGQLNRPCRGSRVLRFSC